MSDTVKLHPDLRKKVDLLFKYLSGNGDQIYKYSFGAIRNYMEEYGDEFSSNEFVVPTNNWLDNIMEELFKTYYPDYISDYAGNEQDEYYFVKFKIRPHTKQIQVGVDWAEQTSEEYNSSVAFKDDSSIPEFMNGINCDELRIGFNGSGDDGYIDGYGLNENGNQHQLTDSIEGEIYRALSREFGGWENNQGASGNMLIDINDESIKINIEYYDQNYEDSGFELNIIE
jgi:hypothetical protein